MTASYRDLRQRGYTDEQIAFAEEQAERERRLGHNPCGGAPRAIGSILAGKASPKTSANKVEDLTPRQIRKQGGRAGAAALLLDQEALAEPDLVRRAKLRQIATEAKELSQKPVQLEFNFFKGNWSVGHEYYDTVRDRLTDMPVTIAQRAQAMFVLGEIMRWMNWQDFACGKTAAELADVLKIKAPCLTESLKLLESVGAIHRIKRGRTKVIAINPEGTYRGDINKHAEVVDRYKAEVIDLDEHRPGPVK